MKAKAVVTQIIKKKSTIKKVPKYESRIHELFSGKVQYWKHTQKSACFIVFLYYMHVDF